NTQNLYVGNTVDGEPSTVNARRDGKLDPDEVRTALRHYIPPAGYDRALQALSVDHVVRLTGGRGVGKRTAGLHLIHELTGGRATIVLLSPAYTLTELSTRAYDKDFGYLVVDREDEAHTAETDFAWRTIRDSVKEAGAYMMVSTTKARTRTDSVRQVE